MGDKVKLLPSSTETPRLQLAPCSGIIFFSPVLTQVEPVVRFQVLYEEDHFYLLCFFSSSQQCFVFDSLCNERRWRGTKSFAHLNSNLYPCMVFCLQN
jgi:hypothetical protein